MTCHLQCWAVTPQQTAPQGRFGNAGLSFQTVIFYKRVLCSDSALHKGKGCSINANNSE
nr:MAG TPA: hypothetical protein [Caudoviricetes sp.]